MKNLFFFIFIFSSGIFLYACKKSNNGSDDAARQEMISRLQAVTDSFVNNSEVPGAVALVADKKLGIDWLYKTGISDIPNNLPMEFDHIFRIGSNSKTMTGTVLLQLVDEGFVKLSDTLSKYFPQYPKADSVTIRMLCNMTSGIVSYSDDSTFSAMMKANPTMVWLPHELAEIGLSHKFHHVPGTSFLYSNTNTVLLGMLIEQLTGHTLEYEITNRIINPLGLTSTGFITSGIELPGSHGRGYYEGTYVEGQERTEYYDVSWAWAAGAAYSTPKELQKYVEALVGGGLISDTLQHRRTTEFFQNPYNPKMGYGLCIYHLGSFMGHNGGIPGFTSSMYHSLEKNCTVIIYFNSQLELTPDNLFLRYMDILYKGNY
jgi:D-alanyl-D-alanine carboxypeptidase